VISYRYPGAPEEKVIQNPIRYAMPVGPPQEPLLCPLTDMMMCNCTGNKGNFSPLAIDLLEQIHNLFGGHMRASKLIHAQESTCGFPSSVR